MDIKSIHTQKHAIWSQWKHIYMCWCRNTIQLKCKISYPMVNSLFSTCSQPHQPRFFMHLIWKITLIHQFMINITIIQPKFNQNRNNWIAKLTFDPSSGCLVIFLIVVQNYINLRNPMTKIPKCLCFLSAIYVRLVTLVQWTILLAMIFATNRILQQSSTITSILLLSRMQPMYLLNRIKLILRNNILFLTCILRSSPL